MSWFTGGGRLFFELPRPSSCVTLSLPENRARPAILRQASFAAGCGAPATQQAYHLPSQGCDRRSQPPAAHRIGRACGSRRQAPPCARAQTPLCGLMWSGLRCSGCGVANARDREPSVRQDLFAPKVKAGRPAAPGPPAPRPDPPPQAARSGGSSLPSCSTARETSHL